MLLELANERMKEALRSERATLSWETINGARVPTARFDLRKYNLGFDTLKFAPGSSDTADLIAEPLKRTWPNQFNTDYPQKWFEGNKFLDFYRKYPTSYRGLSAAKHPDIPFVGFLIGGVLQGDNKQKPAVARVLTLNETLPEKIHALGLATSPELRKLGLASRFVEYSFLLLNHFKVAERVEWDTNTLGTQVSGGWSPTPLWSRYGTEYGRMPNYGTASSETGDGAFYFANLKESSDVLSKTSQWSTWASGLTQADTI